MKEQLKKLWKEHRKPMLAVLVLSSLAAGTLVYHSLESKGKPEKVLADRDIQEQEGQITEEMLTSLEETAEVAEEPVVVEEKATKAEEDSEEEPAETESAVSGNSTAKPGTGDQSSTKSETQVSGKKQETNQAVAANTQIEEPATVPETEPATKPATEPVQPSSAPAAVPVQENTYVPILEGWKASKSAKGDITASQKSDLDGIIESWKSGSVSDAELKGRIMKYLDEQGISYMEVSVTSKGYALYDVIPEIDLRDGGNLYSFVGTYSTGKQNPDGTAKTVCYNWSAFVF